MATFPPRESIMDALSYDARSGRFVWLKAGNNWIKAGQEAGSILDGYRRIKFEGVTYPAHRLAWWLATGQWCLLLDHINGDRSDDRIANLRVATPSDNSRNRAAAKSKSSKYLGVCRYQDRTWHAQIKSGGRVIHLGYFDCEEDAARAYDSAALQRHGEFARPNFPVEARA